jgi:hypothetical protein
MAEEKKEAQYEKPTSQLDLEARQAEGYVPPSQLVQPNDPGVTPFDRGGYVGVDPVYQNAANETERPIRADEGAEAEVFKQAGHEKNVAKFDDESPLPIVDPENDPLVADPEAATGENASTPTGKAAEEQKTQTAGGATTTSQPTAKAAAAPKKS